MNHKQSFTDEEIKTFEKEYAKKKGWGEHPYDNVSPLPLVPSDISITSDHNQQQQVYFFFIKI